METFSRRWFLRIVAVVASAWPIAKPLAALGFNGLPTLWGDGIHDDTPAWEALLLGLPINTTENYSLLRGEDFFELDGGIFVLNYSRPLCDWVEKSPLRRISFSNVITRCFTGAFKWVEAAPMYSSELGVYIGPKD
jgi:hypothetical protein